ncbi:MAG: hypothetical protein LBV47_08270 [Bacteroidales bacterium]|jgi:hypothetical protein|nr:hypothetical protein [Bacteroidales bacterium]
MKRLFLLLFLFCLLFLPFCEEIQAQAAESNQSISLNVLGLEYVYEHPLDKKFTVTGRGGLAAGILWTKMSGSYTKFDYLICPTVGLESRYYYNLEKRFVEGKKTANNSANFLSVQARYYIPWGMASENMKIRENAIVFSPSWGLRRVLNSKWIFEINTGLNLWANDFKLEPAANARIGFVL